jgi:Ca2+-binding RTX toxin-like protein
MFFPALILIMTAVLLTMNISVPAYSEVPLCDEKEATIYVSNNNIIVNGLEVGPYSGTLEGTPGDDVIVGTDDNDIIKGKRGNDTICGGDGKDRLRGGAGNDRLFGEGDNDILSDRVGGNDHLDGGSGRDKCIDEGGNISAMQNCETATQTS